MLRDILIEHKRINQLDVELAKLLTRNCVDDPLFYFVLLLSIANRNQHSCLTLSEINWQDPFSLKQLMPTESQFNGIPESWQTITNVNTAITFLSQHACISSEYPLRLVNQRLYFARYDEYEAILAERFSTMSQQTIALDIPQLHSLLNQYFSTSDSPQVDWQKAACLIALQSAFSIITGGPGTGKTTTVTKLLVVLQSLYQAAPLTIKLVAPTGKAAARLTESIAKAKTELGLSAQLNALIPESAQTIHRLLGVIPNSNKFRHNRHNLLNLDLLLVDEASMVDLALMVKLIEALPKHARLILLGDKDQLSSVDTGNILSDLCQDLTLGQMPMYSEAKLQQLKTALPALAQQQEIIKSEFSLTDSLAYLQKSYRFTEHSGIGQLAKAVNDNNPELLQYIEQQQTQGMFQDIQFYLPESRQQMIVRAATAYSEYLTLIKHQASVAEIHDSFAKYQLLAAVKKGPYGVEELNQEIEKELIRQGALPSQIAVKRHYAGMPIMISQNDYQLGLFNGDIGILIKDQAGQLKATFITDDGKQRAFVPTRLPAHEKVYVMTIHKSQGSEFEHTALVLPPLHLANQGINRQLVYTGITRAKKKLDLIIQKPMLLAAMKRSVSRSSGLYQRLSVQDQS